MVNMIRGTLVRVQAEGHAIGDCDPCPKPCTAGKLSLK